MSVFRRKAFYPNNMIKTLGDARPKFRDLAPGVQHQLAELVWSASAKRRRHSVYEDAVTIGYDELNKKFGRGRFRQLNEELELFDRLDELYRTSGTKGHTAGYRIKPDIQEAIERMLNNIKAGKRTVSLVYEDGREMLKVPKAVPAKGMDGQTIKNWKGVKGLKPAPVDIGSLKRLLRFLEKAKHSHDLFADMSEDEVERLLESSLKLLALASSKVAYGHVIHAYEQAGSGRLYAQGINLQNSQRLIKQVALYGLWEYDIANCHFAIFQQMADRVSFDTPHIDRYLANKKVTRQGIADRVGISYDEAKDCLLMTMYGAPASPWPENAIPEAIGVEAAKRLFADPAFRGISEEIKGGRAAILEAQPVITGRGGVRRIQNAFGRFIDADATAPEKLAHLVQGVEAWMMDLMATLHADDIVLLQHDGFASTRQLDCKQLERLVLDKTGFVIELEESRLSVPAHMNKPRD